MKKFILAFALIFSVFNVMAQNGIAVFVNDPTKSATNVREKPNGAIVGKLKAGGDYIAGISRCVKGWCQVDGIEEATEAKEVKMKSRTGELWMHYSVLAFSSRNYGDQLLSIMSEPDKNSLPVFSFKGEALLRPLELKDGWVKVETMDKIHQGWISDEWICGNPLTTCP